MAATDLNPLLRELRAVRDELRDVSSHPLVSQLVDALAEPPGAHLWTLALSLEREFAAGELDMTFARLSQLLDTRD